MTRDKIESAWRTHCEMQWATWPMDSISRDDAQEWANVVKLKRRQRHNGKVADADAPTIAAATVHAVVHVMSSLFDDAIRRRPPLVLGNPFADLDLPTLPPSPIDLYTHEEAEAILAKLDQLVQPQWAALVELGMWVGLRPGEIFGLYGDRLHDGSHGHQVEVTRVLTRHGLREYPKTRKSHRVVPIPDTNATRLGRLLEDRPRHSLIFTAPKGGWSTTPTSGYGSGAR